MTLVLTSTKYFTELHITLFKFIVLNLHSQVAIVMFLFVYKHYLQSCRQPKILSLVLLVESCPFWSKDVNTL